MEQQMFSPEQQRAILEMGTPTARIIKALGGIHLPEYNTREFWDTFALCVEMQAFYDRMDESFQPPAICRMNPIIVDQLDIMKQNYIDAYFKTWLPNSKYGDYIQASSGPLQFELSSNPTHGMYPLRCTSVPKRMLWIYKMCWGNMQENGKMVECT